MLRDGLFFSVFSILLFFSFFKMQKPSVINYLPLGDSYTICTGASEKQSWPYLLTEHLTKNKLYCRLLENPARNGFTTEDVIRNQLPLLKTLNPHFVTLLIGVNDWVRQVPKTEFENNLRLILDELQTNLPGRQNVILITIPDFGVTPQGKRYGNGRNITEGISEFNRIIKQEGKTRNLPVVDIFEESRRMKHDKKLVSADGLHPSAIEYAIWEKMILPKAVTLLK